MGTFVRMLPSNHQLRTITRDAAIDILSSQSLVLGIPTGAAAELREWCSAVTWILSRPIMKIDYVLDLSTAQRATLGAMPKVPTDGGILEAATRLLRAIKGQDNETFLSLMINDGFDT